MSLLGKIKRIIEDAPANCIGAGQIPGAGVAAEGKPEGFGEPGVSKKNQKKHKNRILRRKPINEISIDTYTKKGHRFSDTTGKKFDDEFSVPKKVGTVGKTHDLVYNPGGDYHDSGYMAVHRKTGKIDVTASGDRTKHKKKNTYTFHIGSLDSTGKGPKAHDVYHAILKSGHSHVITSGDSQTYGSKGTWNKLSKKKGVEVYGQTSGYKQKTKFHNVKPGDDDEEIYTSDRDREELYNNGSFFSGKKSKSEPETQEAEDMKLVASLSMKRKQKGKPKLREEFEETEFSMPKPETGKFAGHPTFIIPHDVFLDARLSKKERGWWKNYMGNEANYVKNIRDYANRNPNKPVYLECERTGAIHCARYGK